MNYYNEFNPKMAAWLRQLMEDGHIPIGDVDERSIKDVSPDDLSGYTQCHFFAGIGGWAYALKLAGWPEDRPIWTASCPCQPFSAPGLGLGTDDPRHLWPEFLRLKKSKFPSVAIGEQVAGEAGGGWLAGVQTDVEAMGDQFAAADLCAASCGAPHKRQRLFWLAYSDRNGIQRPKQQGVYLGEDRPWRSYSKEALLLANPFEPGSDWPQPLFRKMDDGLSEAVALIGGYGNAIVPQVAQAFIESVMEIID